MIIKVILVWLIVQLSMSIPKLQMVLQVFRHGARYPSFVLPNDNSKQIHPTLIGQLTKQGKRMQYKLGKKLSQQYWDQLFGGTINQHIYNSSKFYIRTTSKSRTIQSLQCQLKGWLEHLNPQTIKIPQLYYSDPPNSKFTSKLNYLKNEQKVFGDENINTFHSLSIDVESQSNNILEINCQKAKKLKQKNMKLPIISQIQNNIKVKSALNQLEKELKQSIPFDKVFKYYSNYISLKSLGYQTIKSFQIPQHKQTFKFISIITFLIKYLYTEQQSKIASKKLFYQLLQRTNNYINKKDDIQLAFYSGHDITVAKLLNSLGLYNLTCLIQKFTNNQYKSNQRCLNQIPTYASNVIFQLWSQFSERFIKVKYNGLLIPLYFCDNAYFCAFQKFQRWILTQFPEKIQQNCTTTINYQNKEFKIYIIVIILLILIVFLLSYKLSQKSVLVKNDYGIIQQQKQHQLIDKFKTIL